MDSIYIFVFFHVFYPNLMHNTRRKQANQKFVYFSQNRFCDQEWSLKLENTNILMTWACRSYRKNTVWKNGKTSFRVLWSTKKWRKQRWKKYDFWQFRLDNKSFNLVFCVNFVFLVDRKCRPLSSFWKSDDFRWSRNSIFERQILSEVFGFWFQFWSRSDWIDCTRIGGVPFVLP